MLKVNLKPDIYVKPEKQNLTLQHDMHVMKRRIDLQTNRFHLDPVAAVQLSQFNRPKLPCIGNWINQSQWTLSQKNFTLPWSSRLTTSACRSCARQAFSSVLWKEQDKICVATYQLRWNWFLVAVKMWEDVKEKDRSESVWWNLEAGCLSVRSDHRHTPMKYEPATRMFTSANTNTHYQGNTYMSLLK